MVVKFCVECHGADVSKGGLNLEMILSEEVSGHSDAWEKVVRKLNARHMPPIGRPRPDEKTYSAIVSSLETTLEFMNTFLISIDLYF